MIIDTNGFEIGDEVWIIFYDIPSYISKQTIKSFLVEDGKISVYFSEYDIARAFNIDYLYHIKQECQQVCDELNGKIKNEN